MELTVLNPFKSGDRGSYKPARLIEGYSSLIWSERFASNGDFELQSYDIAGTLSQLPITDPDTGNPITTVVGLRDSDVPMVVETHKITQDLTGAPLITTTGRSFETVLDRRTTIKDELNLGQPIKAWTTNSYTAVDAAYAALQAIVINATNNPYDKIPELNIKAPLRPTGYANPTSTKAIQVDPGELYAWVLGQVTSENYGIRAKIPTSPTDYQIALEIYTGIDLTKSVVFDARFDAFTDTQYLLSAAAWKNVDQVGAANDSMEVGDGVIGRTGLDRRVTYLDASQVTAGIAKSVDGGDQTLNQIMANLGKVDLAKQLQTVLFSGDVGRLQGNQYKVDFNLGDIVKLSGDYGLSQFVRIAEFIRSSDDSGEKAYPTFASL